jgi:hypothetical protein
MNEKGNKDAQGREKGYCAHVVFSKTNLFLKKICHIIFLFLSKGLFGFFFNLWSIYVINLLLICLWFFFGNNILFFYLFLSLLLLLSFFEILSEYCVHHFFSLLLVK